MAPIVGRGAVMLVALGAGAGAARRVDVVGQRSRETPHGTSYAQRGAQTHKEALPVPLMALSLRAAAHCRPAPYHREERATCESIRCDCGEDAFFLAKPTPSTVSIGVADGVGGWRSRNVDPAVFSWGLMNGCRDAAEAQLKAMRSHGPRRRSPPWSGLLPKSDEIPNSKELLASGFRRLKQDPLGVPAGGTTACLASLQRNSGKLTIANLGDSGALVVRGSRVLLTTRPQQFDFNYPYQLSVDENGFVGDISPMAADFYSTFVEDGDLVVLMTDGILDNLSRKNITEALEAGMNRNHTPQELAEEIVQLATVQSKSDTDSPFSLAARAAGYFHPPKGKEDDMTVVVAQVEGVADWKRRGKKVRKKRALFKKRPPKEDPKPREGKSSEETPEEEMGFLVGRRKPDPIKSAEESVEESFELRRPWRKRS